MAKDLIIRSSTEEFITFKLQEKDKGIQVRYENETLWMTQKAMAELFDVEQPAIAKHLINIYNEKELDKDSTYSKMELVQKEGNRSVKRNIEFYNLDAIISVGYRVNSLRATQFRRWATNILKTFTIQGYVLDKERMKNGSFIDKDYFEKLLEEIREIRISERRFYQKVTDIYATSIDYDPKSPISKELDKKSVTEKCSLTADDGKNYNTTIYSLDAIIAVGYRVNSKKATEFRIWATKILKEYMIKGFALNDERFINGNKYNVKYFDELLERIKTIRVSERMAYQKITDLFIATAADYNPKLEEAYTFFKIVQNKLHFAIS